MTSHHALPAPQATSHAAQHPLTSYQIVPPGYYLAPLPPPSHYNAPMDHLRLHAEDAAREHVARRHRVLRMAQIEMEEKLSEERRHKRRATELAQIQAQDRLDEDDIIFRRGRL